MGRRSLAFKLLPKRKDGILEVHRLTTEHKRWIPLPYTGHVLWRQTAVRSILFRTFPALVGTHDAALGANACLVWLFHCIKCRRVYMSCTDKPCCLCFLHSRRILFACPALTSHAGGIPMQRDQTCSRWVCSL
eukprot:365291-Chlamydomonas_euryale.AAC.6